MGILKTHAATTNKSGKVGGATFDMDKLQALDNGEWRSLADQFREPFALALLSDCGLQDQERLRQLYAEALYGMFDQIRKGSRPVNLLAYCIGIGKNLYRNGLRMSQRFARLETLSEVSVAEAPYWEQLQRKETRSKLLALLREMGQPCMTILKAFYFQRIKLIDLAERMEELAGRSYTYQSLRVRKVRCMDALKERVIAIGGC